MLLVEVEHHLWQVFEARLSKDPDLFARADRDEGVESPGSAALLHHFHVANACEPASPCRLVGFHDRCWS